ncbi:hypothetical protein [Actinoplanes sp. URMC 104]|uniref:hypothetical protein n=1 Tax=Actinoplanes sp. URMC 104 TaxID=3423409 RepID=UPI003F197400
MLVALLHFDRHPDQDLNMARLDEFRRLSDSFRASESWWAPIMNAWNDLASKTEAHGEVMAAMDVLKDAILRLDSRLAAEHGLGATREGAAGGVDRPLG